jgi:ketosteroid isomerase-like protein
MTIGKSLALLLAGSLIMPTVATAQRQSDVDAINRVIDQYGALEDAMDMAGQAKLMAADRVWIAPGAGRRTDQATNMRIQQAAYDALKKQVPGIQTFTEDRDRLIRFHANGAVAIVSFYRYTSTIVPPNTAPEVARTVGAAVPPAVVTLVLEKRDGDWKIVHTQVTSLVAAN